MSISSVTSSLSIQQLINPLGTQRPNQTQTGVQQPDIAVSGSQEITSTTTIQNKQDIDEKNTNSSALGNQKDNPEELKKATDALRKAIEPIASSLQFSVDEETGRTVVTIIDSTTNEVVRQLPSKEMLDLVKSLDRVQGLLFKGTA